MYKRKVSTLFKELFLMRGVSGSSTVKLVGFVCLLFFLVLISKPLYQHYKKQAALKTDREIVQTMNQVLDDYQIIYDELPTIYDALTELKESMQDIPISAFKKKDTVDSKSEVYRMCVVEQNPENRKTCIQLVKETWGWEFLNNRFVISGLEFQDILINTLSYVYYFLWFYILYIFWKIIY